MLFILKKLVLGKTRSTVRNLIKEGRLVFLSAEQVRYTDKDGKKKVLNLDAMASLILEKAGLSKDVNSITPVAYLGLDTVDFRKIIMDEYNRRKK